MEKRVEKAGVQGVSPGVPGQRGERGLEWKYGITQIHGSDCLWVSLCTGCLFCRQIPTGSAA